MESKYPSAASPDARNKIRRFVLERIQRGDWPVGERVPTEAELAKQFTTSRSNVSQAIKALEKEGIVNRYRRRGTFVAGLPASVVDEALSQLKPRQGRVHIVAPQQDEKDTPMHYWYRAAVDELEAVLNTAGLQVGHLNLHNCPSVEEFRRVVQQATAEGSQALVLMVDLQQGRDSAEAEAQQLLPFTQALLSYPGRVCWLNRAGVTLTAWPYDAVSMVPLNEGIMAGQYLRQQGVSQVRCLGVRAATWSRMRIVGVEMALQETATPIDTRTDWCEVSDDADQMFFVALDEIEQTGNRPTLVVPNDIFAARLLDLAKQRNLKCPEQFCLISFGNDERYRAYNITTVARTASHLGESIGQLVSDQLRRPGGASIHLTLKSMVVERSTFALPGALQD